MTHLGFNLYGLIRAALAFSGMPLPKFDEMVAKLRTYPEAEDQVKHGLILMSRLREILLQIDEQERARTIDDNLIGTNTHMTPQPPVSFSNVSELEAILENLIELSFEKSDKFNDQGDTSTAMSWSIIARQFKDIQESIRRRRHKLASI